MEDKTFELIEKMYNDFSKQFKTMDKRFDLMDKRFDSLESEVKKNSIKIESLENKVDIIAEVQKNNTEQNERQHTEIVEMLSERIDTTEKAVRKLAKVK